MFKRLFRRFFAYCVVCVLCFSLTMPSAFAGGGFAIDAGGSLVDATGVKIDTGDLWSALLDALNKGMYGWQNIFAGFFDEDVCQASEQYNSRHNFVKMHTTVNGKLGDYWICEYCGKSAGEVAEEQYQEYVEALPAPVVSSDGILRGIGLDHWYSYYTTGSTDYGCSHSSFYDSTRDIDSSVFNSSLSPKLRFGCDSTPLLFSRYSANRYDFAYRFCVKSSGLYTLETIPVFDVSFTCYKKSDYYTDSCSFDFPEKCFSHVYYDVGEWITLSIEVSSSEAFSECSIPSGCSVDFFQVEAAEPLKLSFTPLSPVNTSDMNPDNVYNSGTRVGSITGSYGIITGSGDVQRVDTHTIVNEGDHTIYNPVTDTTTNFSDWTYDYSDRSYNLVTSGGDIKVTYGNENITIQEGNTTYNVYYLVESPAPTPSPTVAPTPVHVHSYADSVTRQASCVDTGSRLYVCSCGNSYTEVIPALGHDWGVITRVSTSYASDGQLLQEGYTIYRCSRCGEEYKDTTGQGLITGDTGNSDGQFLELVHRVQSWGVGLRESYTGYVALISGLFPYLPDDLLNLFYFSMGATVFTGLFRRFFWRD